MSKHIRTTQTSMFVAETVDLQAHTFIHKNKHSTVSAAAHVAKKKTIVFFAPTMYKQTYTEIFVYIHTQKQKKKNKKKIRKKENEKIKKQYEIWQHGVQC